MIIKPKGTINEIIYLNTVYHEGQWCFYPNLTDLFQIFKKIIHARETTRYISVVPFYINERANFQEEFDFGGFYIECRETVTQNEKDNFWSECKFWGWPDAEYNILNNYVTDEDLKKSKFLCSSDDVVGFQNAILTYKEFLMERGIPQMMKWLYDLCDLKDEDLPYGYFCFEINSK